MTVAVLADDCDPDNDALTVTAVGSTPNGVAVINGDGTITFTPNLGFSGVATLTYTISDGRGGTSTAQVSVTVAAPANRPPVAVDDSATTTVDTPVTINVLVNDSDPDGDTITVSSVQPVSTHGTVVIVGGQPKYTPNAGFTGFDIFEYTISDGRGGFTTATATSVPTTVQYLRGNAVAVVGNTSAAAAGAALCSRCTRCSRTNSVNNVLSTAGTTAHHSAACTSWSSTASASRPSSGPITAPAESPMR